MAAAFRTVTVARARETIARALLPDTAPRQLGEIVLAPHQVHAAARLAHLLARHGGALLADDVGLGKTFCALAVASAYRRVLILHPAALRAMWADAVARTGVGATLASYESFSRGDRIDEAWDLVLLDEAHHARSVTARRYARIARACAAADTLLLTATPLPNHRTELQSLFALFLGERAHRLDDAALRRLVVRRRHESLPAVRLPPVQPPRWIEAPCDATTLELIERLPPPLELSDGGAANVLLTWSLVRRWASSRAALRATLRRLLARAVAMQELLDAGRLPTSTELAAWTFGEDVVQMALPGLASGPRRPPDPAADMAAPPADEAAHIVAAHAAGVRRLLRHLHDSPDVDDVRTDALRALGVAHTGEKLLAFSEFAETGQAYWRRLRRDPGVARLTARGGEIASGPLPREQVLHRFAPRGSRCAPPRATEAIDLLVTTDLLAEGVDLRDATVVVHLDLPWSPARLEQRVGRARRLGSDALRIAVYAMKPPAPSERWLALERRLRGKAEAARLLVGASGIVLPEPDGDAKAVGSAEQPARTSDADPGDAAEPVGPTGSGAERLSRVMDRIAAWGEDAPHDASDADDAECCAVAVAGAPAAGCLALVAVAGEPHLIAGFADAPGEAAELSDAPARLARAVDVVDGAVDGSWWMAERARPAPGRACAIASWYDAAAAWAAARAAESAIGPLAEGRAGLAERLLARATGAWSRIPPQSRAALADRVARVRAMAAARLPAGIADELESLASDRALDAEAWLEAADSLALRHGASPTAVRPALPADGVLLLVLLSPGPPCRASTTPS